MAIPLLSQQFSKVTSVEKWLVKKQAGCVCVDFFVLF